jgi:hypothetical protein
MQLSFRDAELCKAAFQADNERREYHHSGFFPTILAGQVDVDL